VSISCLVLYNSDMLTLYPNCTAILFDSGDTLNRPKSGHWFLPPRYRQLLSAELLMKLDQQAGTFERAVQHAGQYLDEHHLILTETAEYAQFQQFYALLFSAWGYAIEEELIDALAEDAVYNDDKFLFFDDVPSVLEQLHGRYQLGIVSDTWPSLERLFINASLRDYFSTFVMSSMHGVWKNEPTLFHIALQELHIDAEQAIFIDNSESNLAVAASIGLHPILIDRYGSVAGKGDFPVIRSLRELE